MSFSPVTRWIMRHKLLTLRCALVVAAAMLHYLVTRPVDNPQPQKKQIVQGSFPYEKGWELRIEASYYKVLHNPTCRQTARFLHFPQAEVSWGAKYGERFP